MNEDRIDTIEKALVKAHRERPEAGADPAWKAGVLERVYRLESAGTGSKDDRAVRFVLRFAAFACAFAFALSLYAFGSGLRAEQLAMKLLLSDPMAAITPGVGEL